MIDTAFKFARRRVPLIDSVSQVELVENGKQLMAVAAEFMRRHGCCGCYENVDRTAQGCCYDHHAEVRGYLYARVSMSIYIGVDEDLEPILYKARQRAYYERAVLCPRFVRERLDTAMTQLIEFDDKIKQAQIMVRAASGELARTIAISKGIRSIGEAIDGHRDDIMYMMNSPLGFLTDNTERGYPWEVVRNVMIDALLRGFSMTGNEVNIIASRMYAAKNGLERLLREFPGYSNQVIEFELPTIVPFGDHTIALVGGTAAWTLNGQPGSIKFRKTADGDCRIPVKLNKGMGVDAAFGKATRKVYARILSIIQGIPMVDDRDTDETDLNTVDGKIATTPAIESAALTDAERDFLESLPADVAGEQSLKSLNSLYTKVIGMYPQLEGRIKPHFTHRREQIESRTKTEKV